VDQISELVSRRVRDPLRTTRRREVPIVKTQVHWSPSHVITPHIALQQSEKLQVGDVFDDERRRDVRNVFVRADFRLLHRRAESLGRRERAVEWFLGRTGPRLGSARCSW
jgi:hypothetical protein